MIVMNFIKLGSNRNINCIHSFRNERHILQCMDIIYKEMKNVTSAEELFNATQKRINYLTHIIKWYETLDSKR